MLHLIVVIAVVFVATVNAGVLTPNPSSTYKGAVVLDDSPYIAPGTPFQKAKIAESVVDLIGGTPLVQLTLCVKEEPLKRQMKPLLNNTLYTYILGEAQSSCRGHQSQHLAEA